VWGVSVWCVVISLPLLGPAELHFPRSGPFVGLAQIELDVLARVRLFPGDAPQVESVEENLLPILAVNEPVASIRHHPFDGAFHVYLR